jgi:hypothetical protein
MDASVTFFLSLILLLAFLALRFFEEKRGYRAWAGVRTKADRVVSDMYKAAVMGSIPVEYREAFARFLHSLAHDSLLFLVESLRAIERPLTRLSYRMRQSAPASTDKTPSEFLKTITPEKKTESTSTTDRV